LNHIALLLKERTNVGHVLQLYYTPNNHNEGLALLEHGFKHSTTLSARANQIQGHVLICNVGIKKHETLQRFISPHGGNEYYIQEVAHIEPLCYFTYKVDKAIELKITHTDCTVEQFPTIDENDLVYVHAKDY